MRKQILLIILSLGIIIRVGIFLHYVHDEQFFSDDDSSDYLNIAENVRQGNGYSLESSPPLRPDPWRTPGYPMFLLAHRIIFHDYRVALITQILLITATAYITFRIGKDFLQRPTVGLVAAGIFLFTPFSILVSLRYLTQVFFTFVLAIVVWLWLRYLKTPRWRDAVVVALLIPVCALIRPIAFLLPFIFIASLVAFREQFAWRKIFAVSALLLACYWAVVSPWIIRNGRTFGHYSLSSITPVQLYIYDLPYIYAHEHHISYDEARKILISDINQRTGVTEIHEYGQTFAYSGILQERFLYYIKQMPVATVVTRLQLMFKFFIRDGIRYWLALLSVKTSLLKTTLIVIERLVLLALFIASFVSVYQRRKNIIFLLLVLGYFSFLTGVVGSAGLRFPVEPYFFLLGVDGLWTLVQKRGTINKLLWLQKRK